MDRASGDGPPWRASFIVLPGAAWSQRRDLPLRRMSQIIVDGFFLISVDRAARLYSAKD
jgi:hypothetical protein